MENLQKKGKGIYKSHLDTDLTKKGEKQPWKGKLSTSSRFD